MLDKDKLINIEAIYEVFTNEKKDTINPSHYKQGKVECIDALEAATINLTGIDAVCTANAIKYMWRWKDKGGVEDLNKAIWYIEKIINKQRKDKS
jgi:hypothetical protein